MFNGLPCFFIRLSRNGEDIRGKNLETCFARAGGSPRSLETKSQLKRRQYFAAFFTMNFINYFRSNLSRFITLVLAATKSCTNLLFASALA